MGPTTFEEALCDWAHKQRRNLRIIPGSRSRLEAVFARGIDVTTHYSGTGAAEMAVADIAACVSENGKSCVKFHSCCDISPICRNVLLNHPPESKAEHCFDDLCSRPPESIVDQLQKLLLEYKQKASRASTPGDISMEWVRAAMGVLQLWEPHRSDAALCHCHD